MGLEVTAEMSEFAALTDSFESYIPPQRQHVGIEPISWSIFFARQVANA